MDRQPLFNGIDCVRFYVSDLEAGLRFYRDQLGHSLIWRTDQAVGLRLPDGKAEIVLHTQPARRILIFSCRLRMRRRDVSLRWGEPSSSRPSISPLGAAWSCPIPGEISLSCWISARGCW